jgi:hypothetical protein
MKEQNGRGAITTMLVPCYFCVNGLVMSLCTGVNGVVYPLCTMYT